MTVITVFFSVFTLQCLPALGTLLYMRASHVIQNDLGLENQVKTQYTENNMKTIAEVKREAAIGVITESAKKWKAGYVVRDHIPEFTGGAFSSRYFANLDCKREGVPNSFKMGRRQCYPVDSLVEWLISRLEAA